MQQGWQQKLQNNCQIYFSSSTNIICPFTFIDKVLKILVYNEIYQMSSSSTHSWIFFHGGYCPQYTNTALSGSICVSIAIKPMDFYIFLCYLIFQQHLKLLLSLLKHSKHSFCFDTILCWFYIFSSDCLSEEGYWLRRADVPVVLLIPHQLFTTSLPSKIMSRMRMEITGRVIYSYCFNLSLHRIPQENHRFHFLSMWWEIHIFFEGYSLMSWEN